MRYDQRQIARPGADMAVSGSLIFLRKIYSLSLESAKVAQIPRRSACALVSGMGLGHIGITVAQDSNPCDREMP